MYKISRILLILVLVFPLFSANAQINVLSGPENGSYSRFVNDMAEELRSKHIELINLNTGGSAYNFKTLIDLKSNAKLALIQSDYLSLMQAKDKINNTELTKNIKVVMPLATEQIHLVAKRSSGLKSIEDLKNKRVGIGNEDQGSSSTAENINKRSKISWLTNHIGFDDLLKKLYNGNIEAALIVGSAPMALLDIDPQIMVDELMLLELNDFNGWAKYYESDVIKSSDYRWLENDISTFGVRTLLVVNEAKLADGEKQEIEELKNGIIKGLPQLRKNGHPKWNTVIIPDGSNTTEERVQEHVQKTTSSKVKVEKAVVYRVQIFSRNYDRADPVEISGKDYKPFVYSYKGAYRYTVGEFSTSSDALAFQKQCRNAGYNQAFVVAFKNGERSTDSSLFK